LIAGLPRDEAAVYEDEVDIHLNPKIGYDWTGYGQQTLPCRFEVGHKGRTVSVLAARRGN
jgi:hypothetical protein